MTDSEKQNCLIRDGDKIDKFIRSVMFCQCGFLASRENMSHLAKSVRRFIIDNCTLFTKSFITDDCKISFHVEQTFSDGKYHYIIDEYYSAEQEGRELTCNDFEALGSYIKNRGILLGSVKKMSEEKEEIVCLDLNSLYHHTLKQVMFNGETEDDFDYVMTGAGHCIRKEGNPDGSPYFDLCRDDYSYLKLCCDGEECKVLERTDEYVTLIDVENIDNDELEGIDTTFRLSVKEFSIATGGAE